MNDVVNRLRRMSLRSGDLSRSIQWLRDLNADWELDLLEKQYTKIKSSDQHLSEILKILVSESPDRSRPKEEADIDCGFIASTDRKMMESALVSEPEDAGNDLWTPIHHSSSLAEVAAEVQRSSNFKFKENSEEEYFIGNKSRKQAAFLDSDLRREASSNNAKKFGAQNEPDSMNKHLFADSALKSLNKFKADIIEARSSKRKGSTANRASNKDETILCCICHADHVDIQGKLDCGHFFCFDCIMGWSNTTNSCPLCKREFLRILKQTSKGLFIDEIIVQPKRIDLEELLQDQEPNLDNAEDHCYACHGTEDEDNMLVCDHCLVKCCHMYCLVPVLQDIPHEPWYCDYCRRDHNIRSILPCANLFNQPQPEQRVILRRAGESNQTTSRATSIGSRAFSLPRSLRSISETSNLRANPQPVRSRNGNGNRVSRNNRSRLNTRRTGRSRSSSEQNANQAMERFEYNPDFRHQVIQRNRPNRQRTNGRRQPTNASRRQNPVREGRITSNLLPLRMQFTSRVSSLTMMNPLLNGNFDPTAFDDEFRDNTTSPNLIPSTRERRIVPRTPQEENLF